MNNFPSFQNQIDPIIKQSVHTLSPNCKKITRKRGGRTTIQCRSDGWAEIIVLISRQHGYWKQTSLLLFLELQSALPLKPQNMTGSSLMWPWPVRMMSWKRLIRWCRLWLIPLPNQIIFQICLFDGKLFTNWIAPATCSFILAKTKRSARTNLEKVERRSWTNKSTYQPTYSPG